MATVSIRAKVAAPAAQLWEMIGRFNTLGQWHPLVKRSKTEGKGKGALRQVSLVNGGTMIERLEHVSDAERVYLYTVVDSPFPIVHWVAEIRVTECGNGTSVVEWSSNFIPASVPERDATRMLGDVYKVGLENIKRIYESLAPPG